MSDAFDEIKKINNYNTSTHSDEKTEKIDIVEKIEKTNNYVEPEGNNIKNFVLKWGRKIVDFLASLGIFFAIIVFITCLTTILASLRMETSNPENNVLFIISMFLCMIFLPLIILIITIVSNYFIYLLIDIRDSLKNIDNKTR